MERVRLAQRSITLRKVMKEIRFDCGDTVYTIQPGVYITTMLSVTNTQTPELAGFDPEHYQGRRIDPALIVGQTDLSLFDGYVVATAEETRLGQEILTTRRTSNLLVQQD